MELSCLLPVLTTRGSVQLKAEKMAKTHSSISICKIEENVMFGKTSVDAELSRSLGLTMKGIEPILAVGGDPAEKQFMECCWCLWKAGGIELVEPFIEAAFNIVPAKSRSVLFQRMLRSEERLVGTEWRA